MLTQCTTQCTTQRAHTHTQTTNILHTYIYMHTTHTHTHTSKNQSNFNKLGKHTCTYVIGFVKRGFQLYMDASSHALQSCDKATTMKYYGKLPYL